MNKKFLIGIDEAGRGSLAGPIVVGGWMAEVSQADQILNTYTDITDSKLLHEEKREYLYELISQSQFRDECQFSFAYRDAHEVDRLGIREANRQSMQDVILSLLAFLDETDRADISIDGCDHFVFDIGREDIEYRAARMVKKGVPFPEYSGVANIRISYHIDGDLDYHHISAASIIAKVTRDRMMCDFSVEYPLYGFDEHKGYGTRKHRESLLYHGISPIHRKSYAPVKSLILTRSSI